MSRSRLELWFRRSAARRDRTESLLRDIITSLNGELIQRCVIPDVAYHAVLGRLPRAQVQAIIEAPQALRETRLLQCEDIMHVRPVGQCAVRLPDEGQTEPVSDDDLARRDADQEPLRAAPVIALFDGMPLIGHRLLSNRVTVDDPDGYHAAYQAHERCSRYRYGFPHLPRRSQSAQGMQLRSGCTSVRSCNLSVAMADNSRKRFPRLCCQSI